MELNQLRIFLAVAEEGNVSRASQRLFLSQPSVSAHVKALEEELGVALFARTPRGMDITPAGERLLARARRMLGEAADLLAEARQLSGLAEAGAFRLGFNTDPSFLRVDRIVRYAHERLPGMELEICKSNSGTIREDLESGLLDAGYIYGLSRHASVYCEVLHTARLVFVAPAAWRDKVLEPGLENLARLPWLWTPSHCPYNARIMEHCARHGVRPQISVTVDDEDALMALVAAEKGVCALREDRAARACQEGYAVPCRAGELELEVSLAWLKRRSAEPLLAAGLAAVRAAWAD